MVILGIVLTIAGIGFLCWLLVTLAIYALPFFAGLTAGLAAYHSGAGVVGAIIVAVFAGIATFALAQVAFARARPPFVRTAIGALLVAGSAWARLASLNPLAADRRGGAQGPTRHPLTAGQRVS